MIRQLWIWLFTAISATASVASPLTVSHDSPQAYQTIQAAVDALPDTGGEIAIAPGTYREKIVITKQDVHLRGTGQTPSNVVIVWNDGAINVGGTFHTPTLAASGDGFHLSNVTVQNDYWLDPKNKGTQAVALAITGDKAVITKVRILGHQDTLFANKGKDGRMSRQYYKDCYIEGHVDFVFGNAKAFFDHCELHGMTHSSVMYTAQSKNSPNEDSAFVFDHCTLTAEPAAQGIILGRPWRAYATVVFLNTKIEAPVIPEGWREWHPGETDRLKTASYSEYRSTGPGASPNTRESYARQLTDEETKHWSLRSFFGDNLDWLLARQ
jgi:pectin methylesterase-like acyl-CoA thioesterase